MLQIGFQFFLDSTATADLCFVKHNEFSVSSVLYDNLPISCAARWLRNLYNWDEFYCGQNTS
jgi:hypothetical protein